MDKLLTLPADLPENWTIGQVIAPEGPAASLDERHGYNYLMKAVNDAHRACNLLRAECEALREELARKADRGFAEWHDLELAENWVPYNNQLRVRYTKDINGIIHLTGTIAKIKEKPKGQELIATLPPGYRPATTIVAWFFCFSNTGNSMFPAGITANGSITVDSNARDHLFEHYTLSHGYSVSLTFPAAPEV